MKSVIISCPTLQYELKTALQEAGNDTPIKFIPQRLHAVPQELHTHLQTVIDSITDVDRIYICISSCGGSTLGLKATTAELVIPRTRDCVDILLSQKEKHIEDIDRPFDGCLFTKGWADFNENSEDSLKNLTKRKGKEYAESYMRKLYGSFNKFYYIDTGLGHMEDIETRMEPMVKVLDGSTCKICGGFGVLRKIATGNIDSDFIVVPKGETVENVDFLQWVF
ncbi:MAG: DUF1638 domain-containing protein [Phascolarctobacterium sp.]|nr:DUF1638 domain-containing protein [Phascolarctobacterium sp.]